MLFKVGHVIISGMRRPYFIARTFELFEEEHFRRLYTFSSNGDGFLFS